MNTQTDFTLVDHGSIAILTPESDDAKTWVDDHIAEEAQWFANGVVIEHRYVPDIVEGIFETGMTINPLVDRGH